MYDFTKLDALLKETAEKDVPSCACAVARDEEILYESYYGYADLESRKPAGPGSLYRQASMTKMVTYTILMMLLERGAFRMDQPVSDYFPEWAHKTKFIKKPDGGVEVVPLEKAITVKDAVIMTCGMPYCFSPAAPDCGDPTLLAMSRAMEPLWAKGHYRVREVIRAMADVPVAFEPGTHWLYGFGSELVAGIIEELLHKPVYLAMREYIFGPLGMRDTDTLFRDDLEERLVTFYAKAPKGYEIVPKSFDKSQRPGEENEEGKPSLMTNPRDFTKLLQLWACGGVYGGKRLIREETLKFMRTNTLSGDALYEFQHQGNGYDAGYCYGYGVRTLLDGIPGAACGSPGSFGWSGGFGTWCEADPVRHLSIVYMHNRMVSDEKEIHHKVRAAAYACV